MNAFAWAVLAACIWGIVPLLEKMGLAKVELLVGLFYRCWGVIIGFLLLIIFAIKPQQLKAVDLRSVILLMLGGFLASIVAQVCFYNSLKLGEISKVVPISGIYPLIAFILGGIIIRRVSYACKDNRGITDCGRDLDA